MFDTKIITFSANKFILDDKSIHPEPAKLNIPKWYKDVPNPSDHLELTIKSCKPFLDSIIAGYILKNPLDQKIHFNTPVPEDNNKLNTWVETKSDVFLNSSIKFDANYNLGYETHPIEQLGGMQCPYVKQNQGYPLYKILNPWTIHVPKGYSVLFLPPINRPQDNFEILSGIVDSFDQLPTNFPCVLKKQGSWILKKGEPIASVFPFKKENWQMKIKEETKEKRVQGFLNMARSLSRYYTDYFWNKKQWK
tara:strand:- start:1136 stop:1885 length:750 start_codon:yes stop_codon:yes gene_type:complete